jgi:serpin B
VPGASASSPPPNAEAQLAISSVPRASVDPGLAPDAAAAANAFGLDLFANLRAGAAADNIVFSPTSIAVALAMARAGAHDETAAQMDAVMHSFGADDYAYAVNALDAALNDRSGRFSTYDGKELDLTLSVANAPFAQRDEQWQQSFLDALAQRFGAGLRLVDYKSDAEAARGEINQWVSDETAQHIPELIGPDLLDASTRLVLVNAIYLKAPWLVPFLKEATNDGTFTRPDGSIVSVPMMSQTNELPYARFDGGQAVELGYVGNKLALDLILPDDFGKFANEFSATHLDAITSALAAQEIWVVLPRFSFDTKADLNDPLKLLGMTDAFAPTAANFSGMTSQDQLFISDVVHEANISVDEDGTEASAATAVVMAAASASATPQITFDRPFVFVLRDTLTGAVLFLGQVTDPSKGQ